MKKVLLFILILCFIFTFNVFASDVPDYVINKANELGGKSVYLSRDGVKYLLNSQDTNSVFYTYEESLNNNVVSCSSNFTSYAYDTDGTIFSTNSEIANSLLGGLNIVFYWSNVDVYTDSSATDVFFSAPKLPVLTQATQAAGMMALGEIVRLSGPIGILMVGSVGLWKGWSFLRTVLSGA